jgi:hypothetical protein
MSVVAISDEHDLGSVKGRLRTLVLLRNEVVCGRVFYGAAFVGCGVMGAFCERGKGCVGWCED